MISFGTFINVTNSDVDSWRQQIERMKRYPHRGHFEIWCEYLPESERERAMLRSMLIHERIAVHAPFVGLSLTSGWADLRKISRDRIQASADFATELGAEVLTIHPGEVIFDEQQDAALERLCDAYSALQAGAGDLTVAIENMPDHRSVRREAVTSINDFGHILRNVSDAKFTLDVGHALQNHDDYLSFLAKSSHSVVNIHLHDAEPSGPAHLELGTGRLNLNTFTDCLAKVNYCGFVSLETLGAQATKNSWDIVETDVMPGLG